MSFTEQKFWTCSECKGHFSTDAGKTPTECPLHVEVKCSKCSAKVILSGVVDKTKVTALCADCRTKKRQEHQLLVEKINKEKQDKYNAHMAEIQAETEAAKAAAMAAAENPVKPEKSDQKTEVTFPTFHKDILKKMKAKK